jgi:hypothetical protein
MEKKVVEEEFLVLGREFLREGRGGIDVALKGSYLIIDVTRIRRRGSLF